jgi:hypothetical protein
VRSLILLTVLVCIAAWAACQGPITCENGYIVSAAARSGCRSPEEPGCSVCCHVGGGGGGCWRRSWSPGSVNVTGVTPWYNADELVGQTCPSNCPTCATCLARDEEELCQLLAMPQGCDCTNVEIGIDPCINPTSCACYCQRLEAEIQACPSQ